MIFGYGCFTQRLVLPAYHWRFYQERLWPFVLRPHHLAPLDRLAKLRWFACKKRGPFWSSICLHRESLLQLSQCWCPFVDHPPRSSICKRLPSLRLSRLFFCFSASLRWIFLLHLFLKWCLRWHVWCSVGWYPIDLVSFCPGWQPARTFLPWPSAQRHSAGQWC